MTNEIVQDLAAHPKGADDAVDLNEVEVKGSSFELAEEENEPVVTPKTWIVVFVSQRCCFRLHLESPGYAEDSGFLPHFLAQWSIAG